MEEKIDILNDCGLETGKIATSKEIHKNGYWHRVVKVLVFDKNNKLLIQKRSSTKEIFPNVWDIAVTGHVKAGELPIFSAKRELSEELGLNIKLNKINFLFSYTKNIGYNNIKEKMFVDCFYIKDNFNLANLSILKDEVSELKLINTNKIKNILNDDYFIEKEELENILINLKRINL